MMWYIAESFMGHILRSWFYPAFLCTMWWTSLKLQPTAYIYMDSSWTNHMFLCTFLQHTVFCWKYLFTYFAFFHFWCCVFTILYLIKIHGRRLTLLVEERWWCLCLTEWSNTFPTENKDGFLGIKGIIHNLETFFEFYFSSCQSWCVFSQKILQDLISTFHSLCCVYLH